jgi:hypothetical protein
MKTATVMAFLLTAGVLFSGIALSQPPQATCRPSLAWASAQFSDSGDYVSAMGSWVPDSAGGIVRDIRINTVEVSCFRPQRICNEARAMMNERSGNWQAQLLQYEIKSWTPELVVATYEARAGALELRFDRTTKLVTMIDTENPSLPGARRLPAYAHLGGGNEAMNAPRN